MGHLPVEAAIRTGLERIDGIEARFVRLPPMGRAALLLSNDVPVLGSFDLDLQTARWHATQSVRARRTLLPELEAFRPDVIHVNSHTISFGLAGVMRRIPTFLSLDATVEDWHRLGAWRTPRRHSRLFLAPSRSRERRVLAEAAAVLAWTDWARDAAQRACSEARVRTLNPGIDLETFRPARQRSRERPTILFVGGRFAQKGGFDLIEALEPHIGRTADLDVVTPFDLPQREGLRVHRLRRGDPALVDLYQQADVFCLPTHADSMGWVILEAMGCGTPVIASAVGGIPDVLDHGRAGVLVAPKDIRGLRAAIEQLMGDEQRRAELARRSRAACEQRFDARKQTVELVGLMRSAVEQGT